MLIFVRNQDCGRSEKTLIADAMHSIDPNTKPRANSPLHFPMHHSIFMSKCSSMEGMKS